MNNYYKLTQHKADEIIQILNKVREYDKCVMDWLRENFVIDESGQFYPFNDVPTFTDSILRDNPELKEITNKTNYKLNQRKKESKELIKNWKDYKKDCGFKWDERYSRGDYVIELRSMFPWGSVNPLIDREKKEIFLKTSEESNSKNVIKITLEEYNLKEIELSKEG